MKYTSYVSFIPKQSNDDVRPRIRAGVRDGIYVTTSTKYREVIYAAAQRKIMVCYGVDSEIIDYDVLWRRGEAK